MTSLDVSAPPRCWPAAAASTTARRGSGVGAGVESEDATKGAPKVRVEDGVDERIKETIDVAQPCDEADDGRRDGLATERAAERSDGGDCEER